jgi:hypothetical protein
MFPRKDLTLVCETTVLPKSVYFNLLLSHFSDAAHYGFYEK